MGARVRISALNRDAFACRGVSRAMAGMNKQLNLPTLQQTLREFEKQSERMDMTSEVRLPCLDLCALQRRAAKGCASPSRLVGGADADSARVLPASAAR